MRYVIISPFHKLAEKRMPVFKLPLSGDVVQSISPWTAFRYGYCQFGLINVTLGQSRAGGRGGVLRMLERMELPRQIGDALVVPWHECEPSHL